MSQHKIKIVLSEAGQKAAVLAGLDARREQEFILLEEMINDQDRVDPRILQQMLDAGAKIEADGSVILDTNCMLAGHDVRHRYDVPPATTQEALCYFVAAQAAANIAHSIKVKAEAQELEQKLSEQRNTQHQWLTPYLFGDPQAEHPWNGLATVAPTKPYTVLELRWLSTTPEQREAVRAASASWDDVKEAVERAGRLKEAAEREAKEQAKIKADLDREQHLAELVRPLDNSAAERIAAGGENLLGLLPEAEALRILTDHVLPVPEGLSEYKKMHAHDVCVCEHMDESDEGRKVSFLKFEGEELPEIDRATWDKIREVERKLLPEDLGEAKIIAHRGRCELHDDCPDVWRFGLKYSKDLGHGLVIEREYGV